MSFQNISLQHQNTHSLITITRPKQLNALNKQTIEELNTALLALQDRNETRVVIITGAGEKAFVAGADIKEFADFDVAQGKELAAEGQRKLFDLVANFPKPVIGAVNGFALGGGLELAMSCHIRLASTNAKMGLPETSLGVIPGYGGTQRLARLIGQGRAYELIFTAGMVDAQKAYEMGLVNHVYTPEELLDAAAKMAGKIARNSSQAFASAIRAVNAGFEDGENGFAVEVEEFGKCFGTEDFKEGTTAFLNKTRPQFK